MRKLWICNKNLNAVLYGIYGYVRAVYIPVVHINSIKNGFTGYYCLIRQLTYKSLLTLRVAPKTG